MLNIIKIWLKLGTGVDDLMQILKSLWSGASFGFSIFINFLLKIPKWDNSWKYFQIQWCFYFIYSTTILCMLRKGILARSVINDSVHTVSILAIRETVAKNSSVHVERNTTQSHHSTCMPRENNMTFLKSTIKGMTYLDTCIYVWCQVSVLYRQVL